MAGVAELKLKKRLLEQQLAQVDSRCDRVTGIIEKRKTSHKSQSRNPTMQHIREQKLRGKKAAANKFQQTIGSAHADSSTLAVQNRQRETLKRSELRRPRLENKPAPPKAGAHRRKEIPSTIFPVRYQRGELPCIIEHSSATGQMLAWICPLHDLDYEHYLPMFVDGMRCIEQPYQFIARQGCIDLVNASEGHPDRIIPSLPHIITPLRMALTTNHPEIILTALAFMRSLVRANLSVGEALVPYYRQLLSVLNLFLSKRQNLGDAMDYSQQKGVDLSTAVLETLELLEKTGGPNAFVNIKYMVPTYESVF